MSLDKAIKYCKEHRKPYYRSDAFDYTCRPHGGCPWCEHNRMHSTKRRQLASDIGEQLEDYENEYPETYYDVE
jgi:hypothetical protein